MIEITDYWEKINYLNSFLKILKKVCKLKIQYKIINSLTMWLAKLHSKFITPAVVKTRSTGLFFTQTMNYRVYRRKYVDPDILTERAEFLAKMKEYRIRNREEFKAIQGEVNNNFMLENKERLIRAHRRDGDKERTSIIKIAMHTKNLITHLKKREIEQEEKDKWKAINEMKKLRERQMYLQAIQIDHEAPTPPPAVIDHEQYFERLQNLALLAEKGMYEEMEKVLKNQEIVDEKNIYLQPLFRNIKKSIRFITKTEEAELTHRLKIEGKEDQIPAELQKLREKDRDPFVMIKKLERHITSLFHLMVNWLQYVEIIYLPESRIQALKHLRLHTEDRFKEEEKEQKEYLKKILKSEQKEEDLKYQTVEEGLTSDTAESETEDNKRKQEHKNIVTIFINNLYRKMQKKKYLKRLLEMRIVYLDNWLLMKKINKHLRIMYPILLMINLLNLIKVEEMKFHLIMQLGQQKWNRSKVKFKKKEISREKK